MRLRISKVIWSVSAFSMTNTTPIYTHSSQAPLRLAAITKLAFDVIPQDPTRPEYRQGGALGDDHKHWFRAKFFQQYRLFFRYHAPSKVIVYAGVNDGTKSNTYPSSAANCGTASESRAPRWRRRLSPADS